jgi:tetratricopeptide (TPR) repeat protein
MVVRPAAGRGLLGGLCRASHVAAAPTNCVEETMHKHLVGHCLMLSACLLAGGAPLRAQETTAQESRSSDESRSLRFQLLDEPLVPFQPLQLRSAAESNRINAEAWFSTGYLLQQRRNYLGAYRAFQQVVSYDPAALDAYDSLWRLAAGLRRYDAAVRYMLKLVELDPSRYRDLRSVLSRFGEVPEVVTILEQARNSPDLNKETPGYLVLMHKLGQLYRSAARYAESAEVYKVVLEALEKPERFQLSRDQLRGILGSTPEAVSYEAGQVFVEAGKGEEALAVLEKVRASDTENVRLSYYFARTYLKLGRAKEALAELDQYFERAGRITDPAVYELQAEIFEKLGRKDELIPMLEQADDQNTVRRYFLADQYRLAGDYEKAEKLYVALLAQDPKPEGYRGLADLYRRTEKYEELLKHLGRTWRENENDLRVVQEELDAIAEDAEAVEHIVTVLRKQLEDAPNDVLVGSIYAGAFLARLADEREAAESLYRAALERRSDAGWYFELGRMHFLAKEYQQAADVFAEASEKIEGVPLMFQIFLVRSLTLDGQTDKALETAERLQKETNYQENRDIQATLRGLSAWVYYYAKRYDEAKQAYEKLIEDYWSEWPYGLVETDGVLPNSLRDAHFALSNIYVEQGDYKRSEELLLRILADDPEDPHANNDLGYLWADQGKQLDKAEEMIRKAVEAEPDNAAYLDSLGWVLFHNKQYEQARESLKRALEQSPEGDPVMWDHLGDVHDALQESEEARHAWNKALELMEQEGKADRKRMEQIREKLKNRSP